MQDLFDIQPHLQGYEKYGSEPNLRELIFKYYNKHFTYEDSLEITEQYIGQLLKQYKGI